MATEIFKTINNVNPSCTKEIFSIHHSTRIRQKNSFRLKIWTQKLMAKSFIARLGNLYNYCSINKVNPHQCY